jgi:hypothetical protein
LDPPTGSGAIALTRVTARRIPLIGMLFSVMCLAYFYALDRVMFSSAHFSPIFQRLLTVEDLDVAWLAVAICLLAALWNRPNPILRLIEFLGERPHSVAIASAATFALGALFVYHDYPFSMDEYAAVFQSKIFASGYVVAHLPRIALDWLVVPGFNGSFLIASRESGRAIEGYWPGFALLLAPFQFFGVPWLCNASLAGLAILLIYRITHEITGDRGAAGWAMLFTLASGAFVANAMSYYSMQAHLTANLLFVALLLKPTRSRAVAAGLVGSLALILHNPVPHALFAIPWIVAMTADQQQRHYLPQLILGYLPGVAVALGWLVLRSNIASEVHNAAAVSGIAAGVFAWPDAVLINMRAASLAKTWIWASPCLFVFAILGRVLCRDNRQVRLLAQSAALTFVGYLFVKLDQGHGWGYRYFHSAWGSIPILAACAMGERSQAQRRLVSFAGATAILSLLIVVPFQLHQIDRMISRHLEQIPPPTPPGNNVYFIEPSGGFYMADMVQIDPLLREHNLLLLSHGAESDAKMIRQSWPNAVKTASGRWGEQWSLGPTDQRRDIPGRDSNKHLVFASTEVDQPH